MILPTSLLISVFIPCLILTAMSDKKERESFLQQAKDTHHIKEHLKEIMGMDDEAVEKYMNETDTEVQFFLMHDYDNNSRLDGLELLKGLSDHEHNEKEDHPHPSFVDEASLVELIDEILEDQDVNNDGYIDFPEFAFATRPQGHTGGGRT